MLHPIPTLAAALAAALQGGPSQGTFTLHADLVYATVPDDQGAPLDLALDLYVPAGPGAPWPTVVWIHGGGWSGGSKDDPAAAFLTERGFAVASIEYRLSHQALWPAQLQDCRGAVRWLRVHAVQYGLDPDRFGAWGPSAGGHLAALLGTAGSEGVVRIGSELFDLEGASGGNLDRSSRVQAVVDWYGPTRFGRMDQFPSNIAHDSLLSPESKLIGGAVQLFPERVASADPTTYLTPDDPPFLIAHGTADLAVPYDQSELLWRAAVENTGLEWQFEPVLDAAHGGPEFDVEAAASFFEAHLRDLPPVTVGVTAAGVLAESGPSTGAFVLARSGDLAAELEVEVAWAGSAAPGSDVAALPTIARFAAGQAQLTWQPIPLDDALVEDAETLELRLAPRDHYRVDAGAAAAALEVQDDESPAGLPVVQLLAVDRTATEGTGGDAHFQITRFGGAGGAGGSLAVAYRVRGSALPGVDHDLTAGTLVLPPGAAAGDLFLTPVQDGLLEATELFLVELEDGSDYALGAERSQSGRLLDDENVSPLPRVGVQTRVLDLIEGGPPAVFEVTRTGPGLGPLTVQLAWSGDALGDVAPLPASATFAPGQRWLSVAVTPLQDGTPEPERRIELAVAPGAGYLPCSAPRRDRFLIDDEASATPAPTGGLRVGPLALGRVAELEVDSAPGDAFLVLGSSTRGFQPLFGSAVLIDLASAFPAGGGTVGPGGVGQLSLPVPDNAALVEVWFSFQALALPPAGAPALSVRRDRRVGLGPLPSD